MTKKALNLYLDKKLVREIEKDIEPYKISNFVTKLFSEYLENKKGKRVMTTHADRNHSPSDEVRGC